jgi:hypothetical protein
MIVIEKNEGTKISYEVLNDTKIIFDDELLLKLSKLQKDEPVHKDICYDAEGDLVIGTESGKYYVAEIDIPAVEYEAPTTEGEAPIAKPLDMEKVTLTLWNIDNKTKVIKQ